jgi:serralysin
MADSFSITLTGDQEVPANTSRASGTGTVAWDSEAQTAAYEITVEGVDFGPILGLEAQTEATDDDVTNMHVHNAASGVNGPVVFGQVAPAHDDDDLDIALNDADGSWTISGIWETTDPAAVSLATFADELDAASAGSDAPLYFNVHTEEFPGGEIRGQWVAEDGKDGETNGTDGGEIDWEALAERVLAFFAATGSWGLISEWLSDTPPDGAGPPTRIESPDTDPTTHDQNDHHTASSDWHL